MSEFAGQALGLHKDHDSQTVVCPETRTKEQCPAIVARAGTSGQFAWEEFVLGQFRNPHTRAAYLQAIRRFLNWVEPREPDLARITPGQVGRYFDDLPLAIPTKKLHLSAIRRFCDLLVQRHVMLLNPALSVRTERYSSLEGKTPEITREQARRLLDSIPLQSPADRRDKAVLATLTYTAARVGAVAKLRLRDFTDDGQQSVLKFREKGGKDRTIPVRHDLQQWLTEYRDLLGPDEDREAPLFRTLTRSGTLSDHPLSAIDISRLLKRRLQAAGLSTSPSPHSFRSLAATDLLLQGVPLEDVQYLLGHSDVRVTRLYDRRQRRVTRNIVERISV